MPTTATIPTVQRSDGLDHVLRVMRKSGSHFVVVLGPRGGAKLVKGPEVLRAIFERQEAAASSLRGYRLARGPRRRRFSTSTRGGPPATRPGSRERQIRYRLVSAKGSQAEVWFASEGSLFNVSKRCGGLSLRRDSKACK